MAFRRFEDIDAWQKGREMARLVYKLTSTEAFRQDFGLRDQITRSSVSIMNNVAEGFDGGSDAEFIRFIVYAQRSATEVQSCLYVALDNGYVSTEEFQMAYHLAGDAKKLIGGLIKYLKKS